MRKFLWIIALLVAAISAPTVLRASSITYSVNQTVGAGGVSGTITTDGTIGGIGAGNIGGWSLALADGTNIVTLTPINSSVTFVGCCGPALTATATDLTFHFGLSSFWGSQFDFNGIGSTVGSLCISWYCSLGSGIEISNLNSDGVQVFAYMGNAPVVIATATATPEPGALSLMLTAIGSLGLLAMKRTIAQCQPQDS